MAWLWWWRWWWLGWWWRWWWWWLGWWWRWWWWWLGWCGDNLCIVSCRRRPSTKQEPLLFLIWGSAWACALTTTMDTFSFWCSRCRGQRWRRRGRRDRPWWEPPPFVGHHWDCDNQYHCDHCGQSSRSPQPIRGPQPPQVVPERLLEHQGWSVAGALVVSIAPGGHQYCYSWLWKYLLFSEVFHCTELSWKVCLGVAGLSWLGQFS